MFPPPRIFLDATGTKGFFMSSFSFLRCAVYVLVYAVSKRSVGRGRRERLVWERKLQEACRTAWPAKSGSEEYICKFEGGTFTNGSRIWWMSVPRNSAMCTAQLWVHYLYQNSVKMYRQSEWIRQCPPWVFTIVILRTLLKYSYITNFL